MAHRCGSTTRPRILARPGHDSPIFSVASLKCRAVSLAVPRERSCSCGCWRTSSEIRLLIGSIFSQMQSAFSLPQRGHSSDSAESGTWGELGDMASLYAPQSAATTLNGRKNHQEVTQD